MRDLVDKLQDEKLQQRFNCKICYADVVQTVFLPCGHCVACERCSQNIATQDRRCPICCEVIANVTHIHYS